jgi:catechol 2,3-dioxygenase-like lactoylglutathione lyase family enzyme
MEDHMPENLNSTLENHNLFQVALVVRDIEKSTRAYADLFGVEAPAWSLTDGLEQTHAEYHGLPTEARAKLAFFDLGGVSLELIEPVGGPSVWQEFLDTKGEGVQHIAFTVKNMDAQVKRLEEQGMPLVQRGDYSGGCYSYIDSVGQLAVMLELLA